MEAGEAEAHAALQVALAEKAEVEGKVAGLEDRLEALEAENAQLESMKVGWPCHCPGDLACCDVWMQGCSLRSGVLMHCCLTTYPKPHACLINSECLYP